MSISVTPSLALYAENGTDKIDLAVEYAGILENISANTISGAWKNKSLSGTPVKGGVIYATRMVNASSDAYGTARAAGKAKNLRARQVPVFINIDRENYEEVEQKDVLLSGVEGLINNRLRSQESALIRENERLFFETACLGGDKFTFTASAEQEKLGEIVRDIETTHNEFVDGVERDLIKVALDPATYEAVHTYLDPMKDPSGKEFYAYHGVEVKPSVYLPDGVTHCAMVEESVALPIVVTDVQDVTKVQNSAAYSFGMAYSEGAAAVMPDLIRFAGGPVSGMTVTSRAGTGSGKVDLTIALPVYASNAIASYKYKASSASPTLPVYGSSPAGYSDLTVTGNTATVTTTVNYYVAVIALDANGKVLTGGVVKATAVGS